MIKKINFLFVTIFGIGKIDKIPGSIASLITTIFLFFLFHILNISPNVILTSVVIIFFISLYVVNIYIKFLSKLCFNWYNNYIFNFTLCSKYIYKRY